MPQNKHKAEINKTPQVRYFHFRGGQFKYRYTIHTIDGALDASRKRLALDLSKIKSAVISHETNDGIELLFNKPPII